MEAYQDDIQRLLDQGLTPRLVYQKLAERPEFTSSESAVWRMTKKLRQAKAPEAVGRLETAAGGVAQVDFGEVTRLVDPATGELRRTWAMSWVLGWSRHTPHLRWGQVCMWSRCSISSCPPFGYAQALARAPTSTGSLFPRVTGVPLAQAVVLHLRCQALVPERTPETVRIGLA